MSQTILIGINALTAVDANVYSNHLALFYHLGKISEKRGWKFITYIPIRTSIDRMRNEAGRIALLAECSHLVFIDDDMLLQENTIESLIDADKDIIMAHTYIRGYPFKPMAFKAKPESIPEDIQLDYYDNVLEDKDENGLTKCDAIGFATVAIKCDVLKKMEAPWFITGVVGTEDIYFCVEAQKRIPDLSVYVDTKVPTGHKMDPEFVHPLTREKLMEFYKPDVEKTEGRSDRTESYHEMISRL